MADREIKYRVHFRGRSFRRDMTLNYFSDNLKWIEKEAKSYVFWNDTLVSYRIEKVKSNESNA